MVPSRDPLNECTRTRLPAMSESSRQRRITGAKPLPGDQVVVSLETLEKGPEDFHAAHGAPGLGRKRGRPPAKFFRKALELRVDVQPDPDDHVIDGVDFAC